LEYSVTMSSIFTQQLRFLRMLALIVAFSWFPTRAVAEPNKPTIESPSKTAAGWQVSFDPDSSKLECRHPVWGVQLTGRLSFFFVENEKRIQWSIQKSRDFATQRLALVNEQNDVQGYVAINADNSCVRLTVLHRPPQWYDGELHYEVETHFGARSFACRTHVPNKSSVVQMASGSADSLLNDSIFDPERDLALRFGAKKTDLTTPLGDTNGADLFRANLTTSILETGEMTLELLPHYYRSRYVPNYRLIDRKRCPTAPTGWMSWNVYFDTAGEKENLDEACIGAKYLKPFGLDIWSIESWQDNSSRLPVSDFYNLTLQASPVKFPHGMKWLAEQIRALGFRPGIWTVPFGTGDSNYYQAHREWFLHDKDGKPMQNWCGRYVLDPSQPEVRKNMEETHRTMAMDWGYEFFKIDGMSGRDAGYSAHFFERPETHAAFRQPMSDPYSLCVEALRRGIGPDRIFLACQGHYTGPEIAWADAGRLGSDIVSANQPPHWENYLSQARATLGQLFTHNLIWYNDPDTLLVGDYASLDMVRLATTVVALPGQLTFFGDKLGQLPPERMRLLQQALPVCDVHPMDLAPIHDLRPVWDLKIRRPFASWDVVSIFNWNENAEEKRLVFSELGLPDDKEYLLYEFWSRKFLGAHRDHYTIHVAPRANVLLAVHERLDRPQFLSTDRHVTQGGVEWSQSTWNPADNELTCAFKLVENDPLTANIHVPSNYKLLKSSVEGASLSNISKEENSILTAILKRDSNGEGKLVLKFNHLADK
jgi:hypothetical protein